MHWPMRRLQRRAGNHVISAAEDVPAFFHEYAPRESLPGYAIGFNDCAQMFVSPSKRAEQLLPKADRCANGKAMRADADDVETGSACPGEGLNVFGVRGRRDQTAVRERIVPNLNRPHTQAGGRGGESSRRDEDAGTEEARRPPLSYRLSGFGSSGK